MGGGSMSWLLRHLTLDWRRLPRPERSGLLAVLIAYVALCSYAEHYAYYGDDGTFSVSCILFPWNCPKPLEVVKAEPEHPPMRVTPLVYCPACPVRKHHGGCLVRLEIRDENDIIVGISRPPGPLLADYLCDYYREEAALGWVGDSRSVPPWSSRWVVENTP